LVTAQWDDQNVKALTGLLTAIGLAAGVGAAAFWHWSRSYVTGGWTLYSPLNGPPSLPTHHPGWWPTLLIFPVAGVVLGLLASFGLSRLGSRSSQRLTSH
jgi:hypothetical protein